MFAHWVSCLWFLIGYASLASNYVDGIEGISPNGEIARKYGAAEFSDYPFSLQVNGPWLTTVRFLQKVEAACCVEIALALAPMVCVPTELLGADSLYHLKRGTVVYNGNVLVGGCHWGIDCILERIDLRSLPARAFTFVEVSSIKRDALLEIINKRHETIDGTRLYYKYPMAARKTRWEAIRLGVKALLVNEAKLMYGGTIPSIAGSAWKRTLAGMGQDAFSAEDLRAMKQEEQLAAKEEKSKKKRLGRLSKDRGLSRSSTRELSTNGKNGNGHI